MEYLIIEGGMIKEHCCGPVLPDGAVEVDSFGGIVGDPVTYYNAGWSRKSDIELYRENIAAVPSGYRLNSDGTALVEMTQVERINAGLETLPAGYKLDGGSVVEKTAAEKLAGGEITQEVYDALLRAQYKARVVELIRRKYSVDDEYAVLNKGITDTSDADYVAYRAYIAECKAISGKKITRNCKLI